MTRLATLSATALLALAACGGDDEESEESAATSTPTATATVTVTEMESPTPTKTPAPLDRTGTKIVLAGSDFGTMLFNGGKQAIYIFERDEKDTSNCYGECAEAWPPVFSKGEPAAGKGVRQSLLGTIKRRDGGRQVTYAGQPLYYYAHEGPGQVLCHNVQLNGGLWWVVGPSGKRPRSRSRPADLARLAVAALRLRSADRDDLEPVRAGRERAQHRRRHAHQAPPADLDDLAVEQQLARAGDDEVRLLLLAVAVADRAPEVRRVAPVAHPDVARAHRPAAEASLDALGAARDDVVQLQQIYVRVVGHDGRSIEVDRGPVVRPKRLSPACSTRLRPPRLAV